MEEMAVARPLLELDAADESTEGVTFVACELVAEQREDRHVDRGRDLLDPRLQLLGLAAHQLIPVTQDDVLTDLLRCDHLRSQRLRDAIDAHAALKRLERACEAGAAQSRR